MTDCSELMAKLNSIEAAINALDSRFIPIGDREEIVNEGGTKGYQLALAGIPLVVLGMARQEFYGLIDGNALARALQTDINNLSKLSTDVNAEIVKVKNGLRRTEGVANLAKSKADDAITETRGLRGLWNNLDNKVTALSNKIDNFFARITNKIDDVARVAAKALGLSDDALRIGKQALSMAGKVLGKILWIIDAISAIFSIINAIDLRNRMNILERRMSGVENEVSALLGRLFGMFEQVRALVRAQDIKIDRINDVAGEARRAADSALRHAQDATQTASEAMNLSRAAFSTAVAYGAQVALGVGLATAANAKASQALQTKAIPGPKGERGLQGLPGRNGLNGERGLQGIPGMRGIQGERGYRGFPGAPGRNGVDGRNGVMITLPGRPGRDGRNGVDGRNGAPGRPGRDGRNATENPMNDALLRRIHAQTIKNGTSATQIKTVQSVHLATTQRHGLFFQNLVSMSQTIGNRVNKTWDFLQIDRVLTVMTYFTAVHNAYFLSRDIGDTLFWMISNILDLVGIEKADGGSFDVGAIVNNWLETAITQAIGEETLSGIKESWAKHSRIYQAANNMIWSIRSIIDSTNMVLETTGNYVAKIGNAMRRVGVVTENAYGFMDEKLSVLSKSPSLWRRVNQGLETVDDVTNDLASISGEVLEITEQINQFQDHREEYNTAIQDNGGVLNIPSPSEMIEQNTEDKLDSEAPLSLENANPYERVQ